jgi:long-chain acyl-CoA synthetase
MPMSLSLTQGLRRAALIKPRVEATREGAESRTWAEVAERVARLAGVLRAHGVARGDRVAVLALNSARYFEALFAVPWAGGAAVPLNTRLAAPEIVAILADAGAGVLLIDDTFAPMADALRPALTGAQHVLHLSATPAPPGLPGCDALIAGTAPVDDAGCQGDDLAGIYYTGGTTGRAKGVMLSHTNLVANALNVIAAVEYTRDTRYLHAPPMFHLADGCSTFGVTLQGGSHVFMPRFDPLDFLETVARERVTDVTLVPTMLNMIVSHPRFAEFDLASLTRVYVGASPLPEALLARALAAMPHSRFQQAWGMTELSPIGVTMDPRYSVLEGPNAGRIRSCGQPVATVELRIVDEAGREVPRGTVGEIAVRGPTVMRGYWGQPEATAQVLRDGWLHSGDAAYMDAEGFVYIVDRIKDMIITGGENVYSGEVENAIAAMPGVAEVAVIGIPHDTWGEMVHAVVVPRPGVTLSADAVDAHCRERIAAYKCPRSVEIRTQPLPLSAAGKVLKTALREPWWQGRGTQVN